jgi:outer membrane lipoprotein-sorting protein
MTRTIPMKSIFRSLAALLAAIFLLSTAPVAAATPQRAVQLSPADQVEVQRVEQYLNSLRTMAARFVQYADGGGTAEGRAYVSRPGHMRFEYDPPSPILIVANGYFVIYVDKKMQETTYLPIGSTPAWFLLQDRIRLGGDVTITNFEHCPGVIRVTLVQTKEPEAGTVTLTFSDRPLELKQWTIVDPQGKRTTVALSDLRTGGALDPKLFVFNEGSLRSGGN